MLSPGSYYALMSIMKYGSLALAIVFAGRIVAFAASRM
jgi:hypothetical protein